MASDKSASSEGCSRCGKPLRKSSVKAGIRCGHCSRVYHKRCFMAECGVITAGDRSVSDSCVCCLSRPLENLNTHHLKMKSRYTASFLKDGFCVLPLGNGARDHERIVAQLTNWSEEVVKYFHALLKTYECQAEFDRSTPTLESGYSNFRQRCPGRFEIIADEIAEKVVPLVENSQAIQDTLDDLLSNPTMRVGKKLMSSGCFLSLSGSETQNYHTDGPALSDVVHLFPYAINVFVPLVAVDSHNGTEFVPGSQIVGQEGSAKAVRPSVAVGDALLFDYRVTHRGLRNTKSEPRPCLYATYSQSWYKDTYNFSEARYKKKLEVNPAFLESRSERMAKKRRVEQDAEG